MRIATNHFSDPLQSEQRGGSDDTSFSPENQIDLDLIAAIRKGEKHAWDQLVLRHERRVFATCMKIMHRQESAMDMVQESFLKLLHGLDKFDGRAKFTTWFTSVIQNVCKSRLRYERLRKYQSLDGSQTNSREGAKYEYSDTSDSPAGFAEPGSTLRIELSEERELLEAAFNRLDPEQQEIIRLCDFRAMSYEVIARTLNLAVGTVKSRLFRAREALRREMHVLGQGTSANSPALTNQSLDATGPGSREPKSVTRSVRPSGHI